MSCTKLKKEQWQKYIHGMLIGYKLKKNAEYVGICLKTSFYLRHKILNDLNLFLGNGELQGLIEMDETFFPESFKGNNIKSGLEMPRISRKRGKQVSTRGLSQEQICVATALDRQNNLIIGVIGRSRPTCEQFKGLYSTCINKESTIVTDSLRSYIPFIKDLDVPHVQIASGKHKNGLYHINHINSLHARLKDFMRGFKGVSTKYLDNYMVWFKWLEFYGKKKKRL